MPIKPQVKCIKSLTVDAMGEDLNLSRREEGSGRQIEGSEPVLSIIGDESLGFISLRILVLLSLSNFSYLSLAPRGNGGVSLREAGLNLDKYLGRSSRLHQFMNVRAVWGGTHREGSIKKYYAQPRQIF